MDYTRNSSKSILSGVRLFTFSYLYMAEKVLLLGQIFEMEILMNLHVLWFSESQYHIFSVWSVYMCMSVISLTQKQITAESSNLIFYICIMYKRYLEPFIKIGQKLCTQGKQKNSNKLRPIERISCY